MKRLIEWFDKYININIYINYVQSVYVSWFVNDQILCDKTSAYYMNGTDT